jgi:hypothetical protein
MPGTAVALTTTGTPATETAMAPAKWRHQQQQGLLQQYGCQELQWQQQSGETSNSRDAIRATPARIGMSKNEVTPALAETPETAG